MQLPCIAGQRGPIDLTCPADGVELTIFDRATMPDAAATLRFATCLLVRAQGLDEYSVCLQLAFYEDGQRERGEEPTLRAIFGLLPGVEVPVPFDFAWLNGQTLFAPRTLGRLKMTLFGKRIRRDDIAQIVLSSTPSFDGRSLRLWPCELLDAIPAIDIPREPLIDELGQWVPKQWPGKITDRAACTAQLRAMAGDMSSTVASLRVNQSVNTTAVRDHSREQNTQFQSSTTTVSESSRSPENTNSYTKFDQWDRFGGWTGKQFEATGWFRVEREQTAAGALSRFWLVDPDGNAFVSTGVDCIGAGVSTRVDAVRPWLDDHVADLLNVAICDVKQHNTQRNDETDDVYNGKHRKPYVSQDDPSFTWLPDADHGCDVVTAFYDYGRANLRAVFGNNWRDAWARITRRHLTDWGVNTIGNWSDHDFIRQSGIPYVLPADALNGGFPSTATAIFRDFPDVFSPEYERESQRYAQGLLPWCDDPNMIGYFMRNEPNWAFVYDLNIAEEMLANPAELASKRAFVQWLSDRYNGDITALNAAWSALGEEHATSQVPTVFTSFTDIIAEPRFRITTTHPGSVADLKTFSQQLIDRYVRIPAAALRTVDPHHLNLGMRYAYITDRSLLAGADCYDVFSINSYQRSAYDQVEQVGRMLNMPVMVGEFHHGALDRGLTAHGIRGVTTQAERGNAYRYYVEQAARSPYFVGAHYFQYNDQSALGRFDGENYQIGLVDVCMQEYPEMADAMRACHNALYHVAAGEVPAFDQIPDEVNPIHY